MLTPLEAPSIPPTNRPPSRRKLQAQHVIFLPVLLLIGSTGVSGVFLAGARSVSGNGAATAYGAAPTTAEAAEPAVPHNSPSSSDSKRSPRPAHVLRLLTQTLQNQCVNQPGHTVTLCQAEIDNLLRLSLEAEANDLKADEPKRPRKPKPLAMSIPAAERMTRVEAPSIALPMPAPMSAPMQTIGKE